MEICQMHLVEEYNLVFDNGTIIIDLVEFGMPKDVLGKIFGKIYFRKYLEELVQKRNDVVRSYAESEKWRAVLS